MTDLQLELDVINYSKRLGDDALILGQRLSEWVSQGPFLEEDIAIGNVALDYVGRARMFYSYCAQIENIHTNSVQKTEDDYAYLRDEREYQNYLINELPIGDFAFTTVRQLLVDYFNKYFLSNLKDSNDSTLCAIAQKAEKETQYHCKRSKNWTLRLGDGTSESNTRMQNALNEVWGYIPELFEHDELENRLIERGIAVDCSEFKAQWLNDINVILQASQLEIPTIEWQVTGGRAGYHTEYLGHILAQMQYLHRCHPGASW